MAEGRCVVDVAGLGPGLLDHLPGPPVDLEQARPDHAAAPQRLQGVRDDGTRLAGPVQLGRGQDLDHADLSRPITIPVMLSRWVRIRCMVRLPLTPAELARGQRLGALLRRARGERSMLETALDAQVSPETLRKIESGRVATPAFPTIAAIADALGLSLDAVWAEVNEPESSAARAVSRSGQVSGLAS